MEHSGARAYTPEELVRCFQQGQRWAFDQLMERYAPRAYNLAYRLTGNEEDARDIAQEAFVRVYQALPRFKGQAAFTTWLHRIVVNTYHDTLRRRKHRVATVAELTQDDDERALLEETVTDGTDALDAVLQRERTAAVQRAILAVPEPYRTVLVLFHVLQHSHQEIAEMLQTPVGTVKSRLSRACKVFREQYAAEEREPLPDDDRLTV
jgi:RNA polymerase sigma-70 factor (ECF subfamily)